MSDWDFFDQDNDFSKMTEATSENPEAASDNPISDGSPEEKPTATGKDEEFTSTSDGSPEAKPTDTDNDKELAPFSPNPSPSDGNPPPSDGNTHVMDTEDQSNSPSFSSSQITAKMKNTTTPRAPLQPIMENSDGSTKIIGINLCVSNKIMDIHDYILYFLDTIDADIIYDYKQRQSSAIAKLQLMHLLADPNEALKLYTNFFGIQDEIPRDKQGNKLQGRRYAGFYVSTHQTYREMKLALWNRLGRREQMLKLGWYLNPYEDHETVQRIVAIVQGKNPAKGYPRGYAQRIKKCLKQHSGLDFNLTIVSHNDRKSNGDKIFAYGIQIGRSQANDLIKTMRDYPHKHFDGIYVKYKADKKDFAAYDQALDNISQVPSTYTGIPVINLDATTATHLRTDLTQAQICTYPIDVESTHLSTKFGKYMVTCPVAHVDAYRNKIQDLLTQSERYKNDSFPDLPQLQVRQFKRKASSPPVSVAEDPFGNLSVLADNSTVRTATYRELRQQALDSLPKIGPTRSNLFVEIPTEINTIPTYAGAAAYDDRSVGDSSLVSKISQLTDENSRLQQSIQSRDETIQSMQQQLDHQLETATQTTKELQDTKQQVCSLKEDLKQQKIEHESQVQRMLDSHQRDIEILQTNHDLKLKEHIEETQKKHKEEVKAIQEEAKQSLQQSLAEFEVRFRQWTNQPPAESPPQPAVPPPAPKKRSRRTHLEETPPDVHDSDMDQEDETVYNQMSDQFPSQEMQNLTLQASHKNLAGQGS